VTPNQTASTPHGPIKVASGINVLAGIWLFVSPWVYGAYTKPNAWNSWVVGALIVILAAIRFSSPAGLPALVGLTCCLAPTRLYHPGYTRIPETQNVL